MPTPPPRPQPADLALLCERHATSKLASFAGLASLTTLGFRGEALASLARVARVGVTTATASSRTALRATYDSEGVLTGPPTPVAAAGHGTTVSVEDLFYNTPTRRRALGTSADEYARVVDLVGRYASHRAGVAFALRKDGGAKPDVLTRGAGSRLDAIRAVYGAPLAKALLPFEFREGAGAGEAAGADATADPPPSFAASGFVASPDLATRRAAFILYVNSRPVDSGLLKRAADAAFGAAAPKGAKPFVWLDLRLPPPHVDANVHPTKKEVAFLHADGVAAALAGAVEGALRRGDAARAVPASAQALLPGARPPERPVGQAGAAGAAATARGRAGGEHRLVRGADPATQTLDRFVAPTQAAAAAAAAAAPPARRGRNDPGRAAAAAALAAGPPPPRARPNPPPAARLASVAALLAAVDADAHPGLADVLRGATFVGAVDGERVLVQSSASLFLLRLPPLARDLAHQQTLRRVDAPVTVALDPSVAVAALVEVALIEGGASADEAAEAGTLAARLLLLKAGPLDDHLGVRIDGEGRLAAVPAPVDGLRAAARALPALVLALAQSVDYTSESSFFATSAAALADYAVACAAAAAEEEEAEGRAGWTAEHALLPALRAHLAPPRARAGDGSIVELARLDRLYRVFERC